MAIVPTNINAYYADLATAKQESAVASQKVAILEEQIKAMGGVLPDAEAPVPEEPAEETSSSEDVSASEVKPLEKMNRPELEAAAKDAGIDHPEDLDTKADIREAILSIEPKEGDK